MILPRKQPPAEWPEDWDEETKQAADMYEAIPSDTNWLDGIEDKGLLPVLPEPLPDYDAPLVGFFWIEHLTEEQQFRDAALRAKVEGPDASVWRYLESIDSEIARLTQACRTSTGLERESNLRQLRESEQGRSAFTRSHEFCEALRNLIAVTDSKNAHCANPTPEQQAAARRWGEIRTEWMRFMESMVAESRRSTLDGADDDTAPVTRTNVERGHCQPETTTRIADGKIQRLGDQVVQTARLETALAPASSMRQATERSVTTHKLGTRTNHLRAVLEIAEKKAADSTDNHAVWAALVDLAEGNDRPPPLIGVSSEGVQYKGKKYLNSGEPDVFTFKSLRGRMDRKRRA